MLLEEKKSIVVDFLLNNFNCDLIYIFGSYAKNRERSNSDLDIAFLSDIKLDQYEIFLRAQKLAEEIKCEVDLVDLKKASTVFKVQIVQGKLIYCSDKKIKEQFELDTLRKYAKLNEERVKILERVWED